MNSQYGLATVREQKYKVSTFQDLNDPFELFGPIMTDPAIFETFQKAKNNLNQIMGLLSCSKSWNNNLLWAHYGDRHKGVVLELEAPVEIVSDIKYVKHRPIVTRTMMDGLGGNDPAHHDMMSSLILHTKAIDWAYENEARLQIHISELEKINGLCFAPFNEQVKLAGIILGPRCELTIEEIKSALPKLKDLTVRKAQIALDSFDVIEDPKFLPITLRG